MADLTQWEPNPRLKMLADALKSTTRVLNTASVPTSVPFVGGLGLGDLTTGTSGNLFERWAYGDPVLNHNANEGMFKDPQAVLDTAFLPGLGTASSLLRKAPQAILTASEAAAKRSTLGLLGKSATAAMLAPALLTGLERVVPKKAAALARKEVLPFGIKSVEHDALRAGLRGDMFQYLNDAGQSGRLVDASKFTPAELQAYKELRAMQEKHTAEGKYFPPDRDQDLMNSIIDKHNWVED